MNDSNANRQPLAFFRLPQPLLTKVDRDAAAHGVARSVIIRAALLATLEPGLVEE